MARKPIKDRGEIRSILTVSIEEKWLINQDKDELRGVAYTAIVNYILNKRKEKSEGFIKNQKTK